MRVLGQLYFACLRGELKFTSNDGSLGQCSKFVSPMLVVELLPSHQFYTCLALVPNYGAFGVLLFKHESPTDDILVPLKAFTLHSFLVVANLVLRQMRDKWLSDSRGLKCRNSCCPRSGFQRFKWTHFIAFAWDLPSAKTASSEILASNSFCQFASLSKVCCEKHCQPNQQL